MPLTLADRLAGGVWGLLVGDALGVPYEFRPASALPPLAEIEMVPPSGFDRAHLGVMPGSWSDDGAHALALLASLLANERLDVDDFGRRLVRWYEHGELAVDGHVFDVGVQTARAIRALMAGASARDAGAVHDGANGNGSLMRALPLALWHRGDDAQLVVDAHLQSAVTHGHLRSKVCCAIYCLWARRTLEGRGDAWVLATDCLRELYTGGALRDEAALAELEWNIRPDEPPVGKGSGYVVDCLRSARMVMDAGDYEAVVKAAIALGNDTDTTACVAGGIAGIRDGVAAVPSRWMQALRGRETAAALLERLLASRASEGA